jgi:hypothetical protein
MLPAFTGLFAATDADTSLTTLLGLAHRGRFKNELRPMFVLPLSITFAF